MRRGLRLGLIVVGVVLVTLGPLALLYTYPVVRPFLPEAEAFEEMKDKEKKLSSRKGE